VDIEKARKFMVLVVTSLLQAGFDINSRDSKGLHPFFVCVVVAPCSID
jgi:hypothetical protein